MKADVNKKPFVCIVIPTYNAEKHLDTCLASIARQTYPKKETEVIVVDGGSTDRTLEIAKKYNVKILHNKAKDAQIGKSIGITHSSGKVIALLDADNEIVQHDWLEKMLMPLIDDINIVGVDSNFLAKKGDYLINRYCTLLRLEDPLARRLGFLRWNAQKEERKGYTLYIINKDRYPVMGAGGFLWRKSAILATGGYKPSFDEADFCVRLIEKGFNKVANIRGYGVYHHHVRTLADFVKKRVRTGREFLTRRQTKTSVWIDRNKKVDFYKAVLYCISIIGPLIEALKEYRKSRDFAWFLHPFLSFITVGIYASVYIQYYLCRIISENFGGRK